MQGKIHIHRFQIPDIFLLFQVDRENHRLILTYVPIGRSLLQQVDFRAALPPGLHFLFGDQHYHDEALKRLCEQQNCCLVTSFTGKNNPYPHHDDGVEVRKILHKTRSVAIENFNEHFKVIFDAHGAMPTKGLTATRRFVLSAVFVYQLAILYCFLQNSNLRVGLKALIKAA